MGSEQEQRTWCWEPILPAAAPTGLQDALTQCIFGGGMLPPNPGGVDKAYDKEVGRRAAVYW